LIIYFLGHPVYSCANERRQRLRLGESNCVSFIRRGAHLPLRNNFFWELA